MWLCRRSFRRAANLALRRAWAEALPGSFMMAAAVTVRMMGVQLASGSPGGAVADP
jgi:hypothetical protein